MSKLQLNAIVTKALLDSEFQAAIVNGRSREKLSEFNLNSKEMDALLQIQAVNFDQFVYQVNELMQPAAQWA